MANHGTFLVVDRSALSVGTLRYEKSRLCGSRAHYFLVEYLAGLGGGVPCVLARGPCWIRGRRSIRDRLPAARRSPEAGDIGLIAFAQLIGPRGKGERLVQKWASRFA